MRPSVQLHFRPARNCSSSTWAYAATNDDGTPKYSGIHYKSRLGDHECWAVVKDTALWVRDRRPLELSDPDLQAVASQFGLRSF